MKSVATLALKPGMIIANDIYSYKNQLLVKENTRITNEIIAKLSRHSIMCVDIRDSMDTNTSRHDRVCKSSTFLRFATVYHEQLHTYKYMMDSFLQIHTPLNLSYLLQIHKTIVSCTNNEEELLDMIFHLTPPSAIRTYAHCLNSALISYVFGTWLGLPEKDQSTFVLCGFFYDIGTLLLPHELLEKTCDLTGTEINLLKTHTTLGAELLKEQRLNASIKNSTLLHHERCDGSGYPNKLMGENIDKYSRYIAIVDVYETLLNHSASKKPQTPFEIIRSFEKQGFEKYDLPALFVCLEKVANMEVGRRVLLSNGTEADIIAINPRALARPILKANHFEIDLGQNPDVEITRVL